MTTDFYIYDPTTGNPLITLNGSSGIIERDLPGQSLGQTLAVNTGMDYYSSGTVSWLITDNVGTVTDVMNSSGTVIDHSTYDSFGTVTAQSNASGGTRFGFTGIITDSLTGENLDDLRDEANGRFTTQDPTGFCGGDYNLYRYCGGDPGTYSDPTGLAIYLDPKAGFSPGEIAFGRLLDPNKLYWSTYALRPGDPRLDPDSYQIRSNGVWSEEGSDTDFQYDGVDLPNGQNASDEELAKTQALLDAQIAFDEAMRQNLADKAREAKRGKEIEDVKDQLADALKLTCELINMPKENRPNWNYEIPDNLGELNIFRLQDLYREYEKRQGWADKINVLYHDLGGNEDDVAGWHQWVEGVANTASLIDYLNTPSSSYQVWPLLPHKAVISPLVLEPSFIMPLNSGAVDISFLDVFVNFDTGKLQLGSHVSGGYGPGAGIIGGVSYAPQVTFGTNSLDDLNGTGVTYCGSAKALGGGGVSYGQSTGAAGQSTHTFGGNIGYGGGTGVAVQVTKTKVWRWWHCSNFAPR